MTVLIAGCGDLGTEVGLRFAQHGHRVLGLRRRAALLPAVIEGRSVDLSAGRPLVPADTEIVVVALSAAGRSPEAYRAAYVDGLRNLLDGIEAAGASPRRFLMVSSTAVYDVDDGSWVDETTPATGRSGTGSVLLEAERMLHARVPGSVVLRLGGIYGPGRTLLVNQVRSGAVTRAGRTRYTNRIHRDDAAAAIVHLMLRADPPAPLYLGVDSAPAPRGEVVDFLAAELGVPAPGGRGPGALAPTDLAPTELVQATLAPTELEPAALAPTKSHGADEVTAAADSVGPRGGDKRCRNELLLSTGFRLCYPGYRDGYRSILAGDGIRHP